MQDVCAKTLDKCRKIWYSNPVKTETGAVLTVHVRSHSVPLFRSERAGGLRPVRAVRLGSSPRVRGGVSVFRFRTKTPKEGADL